MNTQLNRMLFSRAFVKVSACVVLSAGCLPMATYAESVGAPTGCGDCLATKGYLW